jgi:hypothetical protein
MYLTLRLHGDDTAGAHNRRLVSRLCADYVVVLVLDDVVPRIPRPDIGVAVDPIAGNDVLVEKKKSWRSRFSCGSRLIKRSRRLKVLGVHTCTKNLGIHSSARDFLSLARSRCASSRIVLASVAAVWSSLFIACVTASQSRSLSNSPWCSSGTVYFFSLDLRTSGDGLKKTASCCNNIVNS